MNLSQKTIVICGASGGIGQALCRQLDQLSGRLILIARNADRLQALADSLQQTPTVISADLGLSDDRSRAREQISDLAPIDVLINSAGISSFAEFRSQSDDELAEQIHSNLLMPMLWTRILLPLMNKDAARIVNVGSTLGGIGYPGYSAYCASKFGLRGFSEALERELADSTTRVQYIAPRATQTGINTSTVDRLNAALGNQVDDPKRVAMSIVHAVETNTTRRHLGWPERLLVPMNALLPGVVSSVIKRQLPTIKQFSMEKSS